MTKKKRAVVCAVAAAMALVFHSQGVHASEPGEFFRAEVVPETEPAGETAVSVPSESAPEPAPAIAPVPEETESAPPDAPAEPVSTEILFPEADDLPDIAFPEPLEGETMEFIPDESLLMDDMPMVDDFPDFDGGFSIPAFTSDLDPARAMRERIQLRRARTRAESAPGLHELREAAEETRTPYEYREAIRAYYEALYARVAEIDPAVESAAMEEKTTLIRRVTQSGIRPTERPAHLPPLSEEELAARPDLVLQPLPDPVQENGDPDEIPAGPEL